MSIASHRLRLRLESWLPSRYLHLHAHRFLLLITAMVGVSLVYLQAGMIKPISHWSTLDILGEGGSCLLVIAWLFLMLNSRPAGQVTRLLSLGLGLIIVSWWCDVLDEFIELPEHFHWDHILESAPMALGMGVLTWGLFHWHHEQLAISAQLRKREGAVREHRYFDYLMPLAGTEALTKELALRQALTRQTPDAIVAVNLNDFDAINQAYGYPEGDRILVSLTQLLLLNLRHQDLLFRFSGDRYIALLPETSLADAETLARDLETVVKHFAHRTQTCGERVFLSATCTAVIPKSPIDDDLLKDIETTLQRAKASRQRSSSTTAATHSMLGA